MPTLKDLIIALIGIIVFLILGYLGNIYTNNNLLKIYKNSKYTVGIITQRRTETRSNHYRFHYFIENEKYNRRFYFERRGKYAHLPLGKYFVAFDSLKPKNSVLLPFLVVPDSITEAPPEGWKELPIPVDKEEIRKFLEEYYNMEKKTVSSDWSSKVGSFIFSNGVQSFHTQVMSNMIDSKSE